MVQNLADNHLRMARVALVGALLLAPTASGRVSPCSIKVMGVGGGGSNAVSRMLKVPQPGVKYCCVNTDLQALEAVHKGSSRLQIGEDVTRGLGAGGNPSIGKLAAEESQEAIISAIKGNDLVFVVAGMGGGTGSGAAPVVARCAKQAGTLTIGVVTKPFFFEGVRRMRQAVDAIEEMSEATDALIVISNNKLLASSKSELPIEQAFEAADDVLREGVVGELLAPGAFTRLPALEGRRPHPTARLTGPPSPTPPRCNRIERRYCAPRPHQRGLCRRLLGHGRRRHVADGHGKCKGQGKGGGGRCGGGGVATARLPRLERAVHFVLHERAAGHVAVGGERGGSRHHRRLE